MMMLLLLINFVFADEYHCTMESGDVAKIKFRGDTYEETMYKTSKACLGIRIHNYMVKRLSEPSTERRILFMESCVNDTYCKHITKAKDEEQK